MDPIAKFTKFYKNGLTKNPGSTPGPAFSVARVKNLRLELRLMPSTSLKRAFFVDSSSSPKKIE